MPVKVLLVDGDASIREALRDFFGAEGGYDIILAEDGVKALEAIKDHSIDLVCMDVKMPGLDCAEVSRRMKQLRPEIKVLLITASPDAETPDRTPGVYGEAVDGFLPSPFKPAELRRSLKAVLGGGCRASVHLTPIQLDALTRFAAEAMEAASKALSGLTQKATVVSLRSVSAIQSAQGSSQLEGPAAACAAILAGFSGELSGKVLLTLPWDDALVLSDLVQKFIPGTSKDFDKERQVLLKAFGAVITHAYISAIAGQMGIEAELGRPELLFEQRSALIRALAGEMTLASGNEPQYLFAIEAQLRVVEPPVSCWLSMVPTSASMKTLLHSLGVFR